MLRTDKDSALYRVLMLLALARLSEGVTYSTNIKGGQSFTAIRSSDGSAYSWGSANNGGDLTRRNNVASLASTNGAYAMIDSSGSITCWGNVSFGGDCSYISATNLVSVYSVTRIDDNSAGGSFAAVDADGKVYVWGAASAGGYAGDVDNLLADEVVSIEPNGVGYVAVKPNEVLVPWAAPSAYSGDPDVWSVVDQELATGSVKNIYGNGDAFCVLKDDGTVFCWGNPSYLGAGPGGVTNVVNIFTTEYAFAALDDTGGVTAWGDASYGGTIGAAVTNAVTIASTLYAFAALLSDGTVYAWGDAAYGGTVGAAYSNILSIFGCHIGFAAIDSNGDVVSWGDALIATPPSGVSPMVDIVASRYAFAGLADDGVVHRWGAAQHIAADAVNTVPFLAAGTVTAIFANDFAFAAIYGASNDVVCWGDSAAGGDCTAISSQLSGASYVFGNEMTRTATYHTPTASPTLAPTAEPTVYTPTFAPNRPTVAPSVSTSPTHAPQGAPFPTKLPTGMPTGQPTASVDPVVSGNAKDMVYYCRPKNYVSGTNAFQRIEPKIALNEAAGIINASVWIDPFEDTDELSLRGSYGGSTHGIYATYANGRLDVSRVEGGASPPQWAEILQNVAYKFSDYLKPCSRYRNSYTRTFYFKVYDAAGRTSNTFSKGLTIETASVVYSNDNTVQISQSQKLDVNGNSARWTGAPP